MHTHSHCTWMPSSTMAVKSFSLSESHCVCVCVSWHPWSSYPRFFTPLPPRFFLSISFPLARFPFLPFTNHLGVCVRTCVYAFVHYIIRSRAASIQYMCIFNLHHCRIVIQSMENGKSAAGHPLSLISFSINFTLSLSVLLKSFVCAVTVNRPHARSSPPFRRRCCCCRCHPDRRYRRRTALSICHCCAAIQNIQI